MPKPKIFCEFAKADAEGYIRCRRNGEYCGLVKFCGMYGWWEQIDAAVYCVLRKDKEDGTEIFTD
jgi:hypothetical protein